MPIDIAGPAPSLAQLTVTVDRLAFGCCPLGGHGWGAVDVTEVQVALREAYSNGVTTFDTADVYGFGQSEIRLASGLGNHRKHVTIVTKVGLRWGDANGLVIRDGSPSYIRHAVLQSARRLRLDHIPIVLLHWPDPQVPIADSLGALADLQRDGVIGAYGASNLTDNNGSLALDWSQLHVSLLTAPEMSAAWGQRGTLAWGTLEQGLLSGRHRNTEGLFPGDRRRRLDLWARDSIACVMPLLTLLHELGVRSGFTAAQLAVLWVLHCTPVTTAVVGLKTAGQLRELLSICEKPADAATLNLLTTAARIARASLATHVRAT